MTTNDNHPCATCLRWPECNSVDAECPLMNECKPIGLLHATDELRQLIVNNPGLPLLVFAGEDANAGGDFSYVSCSYVHAYVGEYLDCSQTVNDCRCYTDRDEFQEALENKNSNFDGSEQEFEQFIEDLVMEYEPFWKPCIILYVNN